VILLLLLLLLLFFIVFIVVVAVVTHKNKAAAINRKVKAYVRAGSRIWGGCLTFVGRVKKRSLNKMIPLLRWEIPHSPTHTSQPAHPLHYELSKDLLQ
jgi:hypothetical protein